MTSREAVVKFAKRRSWFSILDLQKHVAELGATSAEVRLREHRRANPKSWQDRWVTKNGKRFKQFKYRRAA